MLLKSICGFKNIQGRGGRTAIYLVTFLVLAHCKHYDDSLFTDRCEKLKTELNIKEESWADKERSFLHQEQVMLQRLADNEKNQQGSTTGDESSQNLTQEELELLLERLEKMEEQQNADTKSQDQAIRLQEQKHALEITEVKVKLLAQQKRNLALQTESTAVRRELDAKIRVDEKKNELLDLLESKLGQTKKRSQTLDGQVCKVFFNTFYVYCAVLMT